MASQLEYTVPVLVLGSVAEGSPSRRTSAKAILEDGHLARVTRKGHMEWSKMSGDRV